MVKLRLYHTRHLIIYCQGQDVLKPTKALIIYSRVSNTAKTTLGSVMSLPYTSATYTTITAQALSVEHISSEEHSEYT